MVPNTFVYARLCGCVCVGGGRGEEGGVFQTFKILPSEVAARSLE